MNLKVDVVIVGAGPGGLTAGSILSRNGLDVLVFDRNDRPGGTSRSFTRNRFTFPVGPLGFGNPTQVLNTFGVSSRAVENTCKRARYLVHAFGKELPISLPSRPLTAELCRLYPEDVDGVRAFMRDAVQVSAVLRSTAEGEAPLLGKRTRVSASEYLEKHIKDPSLRKVLGSIGTGKPVFGFPLLAAMWDIISSRGIWYPPAGFDSLATWIAAEIDRNSSGVCLRSEVSEIVVRNGRARGVRLSDGGLVEASAVISNADFKTTFLRLLESSSQPQKWREAIVEAPETASNLQVSLGVETSKVDLSAFSNADRIIHRRWDAPAGDPAEPSWDEAEIDPVDLAGGELEISLPGGDVPSGAPPGGTVVVIRTAADHAHFKRFRPRVGKRTPEYSAYKSRLAGSLIQEVSRLLPGLEDAVVVSDVATPLTFEERGGRYSGAVAGWSQRHRDGSDYTLRPLVLTPVEGLYMAGLQAFSWLYWGGVPSAVLSGVRAAHAVLTGAGPVSRFCIPGPGSGRP